MEEIASAVADTDLSNSNLSPRTFNTAASIAIEPTSPIEATPANESELFGQKSSAPQEFKRYFVGWLVVKLRKKVFEVLVIADGREGLFNGLANPFVNLQC